MKKLLAVVLAVALMFSFAACKSDEEKAAEALVEAFGDLS